MKQAVVILITLMLLHHLMPCLDSDPDCFQKEQTQVSLSMDNTDDCPQKDCTDSCCCACCKLPVIKSNLLFIATEKTFMIHHDQSSPGIFQIPVYDIWQPPKV
ncbi:hypothetical protein [Roseivirga sp.]|uniref:hypothetical protein n=1 Tax=Roseivirga sp. TaxID=1964215 RepID=UPI003B524C0A